MMFRTLRCLGARPALNFVTPVSSISMNSVRQMTTTKVDDTAAEAAAIRRPGSRRILDTPATQKRRNYKESLSTFRKTFAAEQESLRMQQQADLQAATDEISRQKTLRSTARKEEQAKRAAEIAKQLEVQRHADIKRKESAAKRLHILRAASTAANKARLVELINTCDTWTGSSADLDHLITPSLCRPILGSPSNLMTDAFTALEEQAMLTEVQEGRKLKQKEGLERKTAMLKQMEPSLSPSAPSSTGRFRWSPTPTSQS